MANKVVSILGCGWYGMALAKHLIKQGYTVKGSTTTSHKLQLLTDASILPYQVSFEPGHEEFNPDFFVCDVLIISIPPKRRAGEAGLYPEKLKAVVHAIQENAVKKVIFISSTSVYADGNFKVDETFNPSPDSESGKAMLQAENLLKAQSAFKTSVLRFGGLFGPGRDPGRFFAGKKNIANGSAPVNLIHLSDCVGITEAIVAKDAFGHTFNACSPQHPEKMRFYADAARKSGFVSPEFIPELINWKIVDSVQVEPILNYKVGPLNQ